jgi:hypothetical protein
MSHERHSLAGRIGAEIRAVTDEGGHAACDRSHWNKISWAQTVTEPGGYLSGLMAYVTADDLGVRRH